MLKIVLTKRFLARTYPVIPCPYGLFGLLHGVRPPFFKMSAFEEKFKPYVQARFSLLFLFCKETCFLCKVSTSVACPSRGIYSCSFWSDVDVGLSILLSWVFSIVSQIRVHNSWANPRCSGGGQAILGSI